MEFDKCLKVGWYFVMAHFLTLCVVSFGTFVFHHASLWNLQNQPGFDGVHVSINKVVWWVMVVGIFVYYMTGRSSRPVYLVEFACYRPPDSLHVTVDQFMEHSRLTGDFDEASLDFQHNILRRSGLGEETAVPHALLQIPPVPSMSASRQEAELVIFGALDNLLAATGVKSNDIGILVVNCSLFNPTPSLSAMVVHKYKLRADIKTFNLGGMGCSAGVIAVDLAKDMLQLHRNAAYAVVVSTENITQNWYHGNNKSMLIANCLFRVGGSAVLLSNRASDRRRSKYKMLHVVRTHKGADDDAFRCAYHEEDEVGKSGVSLSKNLARIAGDALKTNQIALAPLVLPVTEQFLSYLTLILRKLINPKMKPYVPNFRFKRAFDHFCIHAGGRAVIDEVEKTLGLDRVDVEASRMTLQRFGNTSSSSIWYELAYTEAKGRVRKGERVWQIALGSGFKCNSAVWEAVQDVDASEKNPWVDCIHRYPVG